MRGLGENPENVLCAEAGRAGSLLLPRDETLPPRLQYRQGNRSPGDIAKHKTG